MFRLATLTVGFFLVASLVLAQEEASFEGLGALPDSWSRADNVSADGSVVVGSSGSFGNPSEAIRWIDGGMESLGDLPGGESYSVAHDVSADGSVVVGEGTSEEGTEAFLWENGEMVSLGVLPSDVVFSLAMGVSEDGSVVVGGSSSGESFEAFRWEDGVMEGLGSLLPGGSDESVASAISADGSVIVGAASSEDGYECFRWQNGETEGLGALPGGDYYYSGQCSVSADGSVVVGESVSDNGLEAFRWENGEMVGLGALLPPGSGFVSQARAVSADGSVVVGRSNSDITEAIIWTEADGMRSLKEVLENDYGLDLGGWTPQDAYAISDDGTVIVGYGQNPNGDTEAWRAIIPHSVADETTPEAFVDVLSTPSPNPASGTSTLTIAVEHGQHVAVEVFDVMGRRVQTLYNGVLTAGMSETLTVDASALPAGVYVIRATGEDFTRTRRVTVVR